MRDPATGEEIPTELDGLLRERQIERLVVCGLATDYCVKATAHRRGAARVRDVALLPDGVAAVNLDPGDGERALTGDGARQGVDVAP